MTISSDNLDKLKWHVRRSRLVLDNSWAKVRCDTCELPDGSTIDEYYYWEGGDFAQVFALTGDEKVVLTRQYKHAVKEVVLELPAGLIVGDLEAPLAAAKRELQEETGFVAGHWLDLGPLNVSSAKSTTRAYAFFAQEAKRISNQQLDVNEQIDVLVVPIDELLQMIRDGQIRDVNSIAITFLVLQKLGRRL